MNSIEYFNNDKSLNEPYQKIEDHGRRIVTLEEQRHELSIESMKIWREFNELRTDYNETKLKVSELEKRLNGVKKIMINAGVIIGVIIVLLIIVIGEIGIMCSNQEKQINQLETLVEASDGHAKALEDKINEVTKQKMVTTSYLQTIIHMSNLPDTSELLQPMSNDYEIEPIVYEPDIDIENSKSISGLSAEQFDDLIDTIATHRGIDDCIFTDTGKYFVEVEETYGINGLYLLTIFTKESSFGEYMIRPNNAAGLTKGGRYCTFDSISECILYLGNLLRIYDESYDLQTFEEIASRYCEGNEDWISDNEEICDLYADFAYKNICSST